MRASSLVLLLLLGACETTLLHVPVSGADISPADASLLDSSPADASLLDGAATDLAIADASLLDSSSADASLLDGAATDLAIADASLLDSSPADASLLDGAATDLAIADASLLDGPNQSAPSAVLSSVSVAPAQAFADSASTIVVSVQVRNGAGAPMPGARVRASISGMSAIELSPTEQATDTNGEARFGARSGDVAQGSVVVTVEGPSVDVVLADQPIVMFVAGPPDHLELSQPVNVTAGVPFAIDVRVLDAKGRLILVDGPTVQATLSAGSPPLLGNTEAAILGGRAELSMLVLEIAGDDRKVLVSYDGGILQAETAPFAVRAGPATSLAFTVQPQDTVAGQELDPAPELVVFDAYGNRAIDATGTVSLVAVGSTGTTSLYGPTSVMLASGRAIWPGLSVRRADAYVLEASYAWAGLVTASASFQIVPGAINEATSRLAVSPDNQVADGVAPVTLRFDARDAYDNATAPIDVVFSASGTNNAWIDSQGTTDGQGRATAELRSTRAETKTVQATAGTVTFSSSVVFRAGPPVAEASTLTISRGSVPADGVSVARILVELRDIHENPAPGANVRLQVTGRENLLLPRSGQTNAAGVFRATLASIRAETKQVSLEGAVSIGPKDVAFSLAAPCAGTVLRPGVPALLIDDQPTSVALGDFNEDGALDVFVTQRWGVPTWFAGDGVGRFERAASLTANRSGTAVVADLNRDGHDDVAVGDSAQVLVLLGDGAGGFTEAVYPTAPGASLVHVADFNGDQAPDLALGGASNEIVVLLNDGTGTFGAPIETVRPSASGGRVLAIADFNEDGLADVADAYWYPTGLDILLGVGDGTFLAGASFATQTMTYGVVAGDVNGDGHADLVSQDGTVRFGLGDGSFSLANLGSQPSGTIDLGDVNGDGIPDYLRSRVLGTSGVSASLGAGAGAFSSTVDYRSSGSAAAFAIGDLDSDGVPDVLVARERAALIDVRLSASPGVPIVPDAYAASSGPFDVVLGDVDGDDHLDTLTALSYGMRDVVVRLGPSFGAAVVTSPGTSYLRRGELADMDEDGVPDLVTANGYNGAQFSHGRGDGHFSAFPRIVENAADRVRVYDVNDDGHLDVLFSSSQTDSFGVALGHGDGTFDPVQILRIGAQVEPFAIGDIDEDGRIDVVLTDSRGRMYMLLGHGDGTFAETEISSEAGGGSSVDPAIFDIDGDGHLDVVSPGPQGAGLLVLLGDGTGHFTTQTSPGLGAQSLRAGDYDRDGDIDVATWSSFDAIQVYENVGGGVFKGPTVYGTPNVSPAAAADLDGDGRIDFVTGGGQYVLYDRGCL